MVDLAMGASTICARLATGNIVAATPAQIRALLGQQIIQMQYAESSSSTTTTELIPVDDTIPQQSTEGATSGLSVSITPASTSNRLLICWDLLVSSNTVGSAIFTVLYQDSDEDALAVRGVFPASSGLIDAATGIHEMAAGTTSSTTFKIFIGGSIASTTRTNGVTGRLFGAIPKSSMYVLEIQE